MKKTIGLFDISTLLHTIRQSTKKEPFGQSILSCISHLKNTLGLDEIICIRDIGKSRYRLDIYPEYKSHRAKRELSPAETDRLILMKKYAENLHLFEGLFLTYGIEGIEADDSIGILYQQLKEEYEVIPITTDKDYMTSIPLNSLYNWKKQRYFDRIEDRYDLSQARFLMLQTLMGDSTDGIPSFCGAKTALVLLQNFKGFNDMRNFIGDVSSLEGITPHNKRYVVKALADIKTPEGWQQLKLNYKLVNIFTDLDGEYLTPDEKNQIEFILDDMRYKVNEGYSEFILSDELEEFLFQYEAEHLLQLEMEATYGK